MIKSKFKNGLKFSNLKFVIYLLFDSCCLLFKKSITKKQ